MDENIFFESFCLWYHSSQQWINLWSNLITRLRCESCSVLRTSMLTILYINDVNGAALVSFFNFWLWIGKSLLSSYWKSKQFKKKRLGISCVMYCFKCEENLSTNSIWTYTITTLWLNQRELFAKEFTLAVDSG